LPFILYPLSFILLAVEKLLENLNTKQREAVLATEGPVLILAGPGSGKTATLTARIAYLISRGVLPENILAVTFTNKAAQEMRARIANLCGSSKFKIQNSKFIENLFIGTFHSFALQILRPHASKLGYLKNFTIYDEDDSLGLIKEVMQELAINPKQFTPGAIANVISGLKNDLIGPEEYASQEAAVDLFPKTVHRVYAAYQKRLLDSNSMDFDDLLMNACLLFEKYPEILASYQERFCYINVDEWQDTNIAQYNLILKLAQKHRNIAVVGDDAQSIYGWRGADYRNIFNFERDFPELKTIILDQNYRSTQVILDAAKEIISRNQMQKRKNLWTERKGGEALEIVPVENERMEAKFAIETMKDLIDRGYKLKDMVVLYRTNTQSRALEEALLENNFPYKIVGGIKFYQRKEIKDIIAYLRYLLNPKDLTSLKRIINVPARGIGKSLFLTYLVESSQAQNSELINKIRHARPRMDMRGKESLKNFELLIENLRENIRILPAANFIKYLLKKIKYREYLDDNSINSEERWENVKELVSLAAKYNQPTPPEGIEKLLEDATLVSDADEIEPTDNVVNLMTLHAAKGLEFPVVFMVGMEEGIFPHSRSLFNPQELEEERRLCYVGLTRAKDKVFLTYALRRTHFGSIQANPPSRFLSEIPDHLIKIADCMTLDNIIETL